MATTTPPSPSAGASPRRMAGRSFRTRRGKATNSVPRNVMRGYCVLAHEAVVQQWPQGPTHVFVQAGVGGLAAAVIGYLWAALPAAADLHRRRAGKRRLLVPEQSQRASRRWPAATPTRSWAASPAARSRRSPGRWSAWRTDWFMTIERGRGDAGAQAVRPSAGRRSGDRLGTVGLRGAGRPRARLHRRGAPSRR